MTKSQDRVATHPCVNDKGQIVHIKHPHSPTSRESWHEENAIATFVPAGECPDEINSIAIGYTWLVTRTTRAAS
jgi:hypothetical protein